MTTANLMRGAAALACGLFLCGSMGMSTPVQAGGLGKALISRVLKRDLARDAATAARPLPRARARSVHR